MLKDLMNESNLSYTQNGALTNATSGNECLDLFFRAGAMRRSDEKDIATTVIRAFIENPQTTMKIIFYARDIRGGLGERRFFRIAIDTLVKSYPDAVRRNIPYFAEYGRYDDLLILADTSCEQDMSALIKSQLETDIENMNNNQPVSLLAKWLPSVNASSEETRQLAKKIAKLLGMNEKKYRHTLSGLRQYIKIIENNLRESDYSFDYSKMPSGSMFKYRKAFIRNDQKRYTSYLESVRKGDTKLNTSTLYPYEIVRRCINIISNDDILSLDTTWKNLPSYAENNENAIAVIDTSGSMTWSPHEMVRPIDVAISLGIYFAEHNKGDFANHFITFSQKPRLIKIKGDNIYQKVKYCRSFAEVANTDLEAVFKLILVTAIKNHTPQEDFPSKIYIISDMEFDGCIIGGNNMTLFNNMKRYYSDYGYKLPDIVFWNVASYNDNIPVSITDTGATLVSGFSPSVFEMTMSGDISPTSIMNKVINSERYAVIK